MHNQERDVDLHESRDFSLCGGDGVDGRCGSGLSRSIFLACGRGGLFRGNLFLMEGDIFELGGCFEAAIVEVEVENFEMVVGSVMRLVLWFLNWREDFL